VKVWEVMTDVDVDVDCTGNVFHRKLKRRGGRYLLLNILSTEHMYFLRLQPVHFQRQFDTFTRHPEWFNIFI